MMIASRDIDILFVSAVNVWNRALDTHRGSFPYKGILSELYELPDGRCAGIAVYEDDPESPIAGFTVRFHNGHVERVAAESRAEDTCWRVSVDYLGRVAANAEAFVRDPARLDWDWLKHWAGMDN
jgi:hypothetical protein